MQKLPRPVSVLAGLVILLVVWWLWMRDRRGAFNPQAVVLQVQQLNQLTTVKYTVQKVVGLREDKTPVGSESILLIVQANVEAGVDLGSLRADDVSILPDGTVILRLPDPKILNAYIDEKETKVWDREKTWWTPWVPYSLDLEQRARKEGLEAARKAALDMGILAQAERNAETSIRTLLGLAGRHSVRIVPQRVS